MYRVWCECDGAYGWMAADKSLADHYASLGHPVRDDRLVTADDARRHVAHLANSIGMGFHPDSPIDDYVNVETGEPLYAGMVAQSMQADLDRCHELLGDSIYDVAMDAWREAGYVPTAD